MGRRGAGLVLAAVLAACPSVAEETGSAIPAVGYPVPKAITAVIVLITGYLALFF